MFLPLSVNLYMALIVFFTSPACSPTPVDVIYQTGVNDHLIVAKAQKLQTVIVKLPENYENNKSYPVLVALHGNGGDAAGLANVFNSFSSMPVIIVVPQGQYRKLNGGYSWYYETSDKDLWEMGDLLTADNIIESINEVKKNYKTGNVYIFGFSQGASAAYMTGIKYSEGIMGVAAVGGVLPDIDVKGSVVKTSDINNAKNVKIFISRGMNDTMAGRDNYDNQITFFNLKGYDVTAFQYIGGHEITAELLIKLFQWMEIK